MAATTDAACRERETGFIAAELLSFRTPDFIAGELEVMDDPAAFDPAAPAPASEIAAYPGDWNEFNAGRVFMRACISRISFNASLIVDRGAFGNPAVHQQQMHKEVL